MPGIKMEIIADLHIHSRYSRATSKNLTPESLYLWAQQKGIHLLGSGDFTHPEWIRELQDKLEPAEDGLWTLKPDIAKNVDSEVPDSCRGPVRFIFQTEISTIYKKNGKTRKVHHLILLPDFNSVHKLISRLERIGNLKSDGRPILGLDSRDLLETVLEASDEAIFIPAHIWTPWFSVFGSKSGFDHIEECYGELTPHITALETGLSSDPAMNWRCSGLDQFTLVSNSDAHSPSKLGREANILQIPFSYTSLRHTLVTGEGLTGTIEFFPEHGKYHLDGHRKCQVRMEPEQTIEHNGRCPVCGKALTVGVMNRVVELSDRGSGMMPPHGKPFYCLIPLDEVLGEVLGRGPATKGVQNLLNEVVNRWGPELYILRELSLSSVEEARMPVLAEALSRIRQRKINALAGYDGEFGKIRIFHEGERALLSGQKHFYVSDIVEKYAVKRKTSRMNKTLRSRTDTHLNKTSKNLDSKNDLPPQLNREQEMSISHGLSPLMIIAGPGTGKTFTLTGRIAHLLKTDQAHPSEVLAVSFTQRAAEEMKSRLSNSFSDESIIKALQVQTLHSFGYSFLRRFGPEIGRPDSGFIADEEEQKRILNELLQESGREGIRVNLSEILGKISLFRQGSLPEDGLIPR